MVTVACEQCGSADLDGTPAPDGRITVRCAGCGHTFHRGTARAASPTALPAARPTVAGTARSGPREPGELSTHQVHELALTLVADKIGELGGQAVERRTGRQAELLAHGRDPLGRQVRLRVLARRAGDWQTSAAHGRSRAAESVPVTFWVLVDLTGAPPAFYVVPEWWMQNDIHEVHQRYLAGHGGGRAVNDDSDHHRITTDRIVQWLEQWGSLGIFY